jgi:predicted alpha/beta hydrolase
MGIYDLPAVIDYILARTRQQGVYYIGHSMGTTMFFVLTSFKPEYNTKIHLMVALAPVAFMSHVKSDLSKLAIFSRTGVSFHIYESG